MEVDININYEMFSGERLTGAPKPNTESLQFSWRQPFWLLNLPSAVF